MGASVTDDEIMKQPLTVEDYILTQSVLTLEVVAACSSSSAEASQRLTDIGSRLLDFSNSLPEPRGKALIHALAAQIIATE